MARGKQRKKKRTSTQKSFMIVMLFLGVMAAIFRFMPETQIEKADAVLSLAENEIGVYFLDVGQGDSILIRSLDNAVLIDAGENKYGDSVVSYLKELGIDTLDYVVATHPHSDHIGGLATVIGQFKVKNILMPDVIHNTATFEKLLDAVEQKGLTITTPVAGRSYEAGIIALTALSPGGDSYTNLNDYSVVLRMRYGDTAFIFTGDAEQPSEREMIANGLELRANILKAGHHGSNTATSAAFLDRVAPAAVVISCGTGNTYGHPHAETLDLLAERDIGVYRTDEMGTIVMSTDGSNIKLYTE